MDIGIYTTEDVLEHKKRDGKLSDHRFCYWNFPRSTKATVHDRFYFATKGKWQGYFLIVEAMGDGSMVEFHSDTWRELEDKPERKPFQGFTYKVPKIEKENR